MKTVRCTSMEPASTNNPNTTHTPTRLLRQNATGQATTHTAKGKQGYAVIQQRLVRTAKHDKYQSHAGNIATLG